MGKLKTVGFWMLCAVGACAGYGEYAKGHDPEFARMREERIRNMPKYTRQAETSEGGEFGSFISSLFSGKTNSDDNRYSDKRR